MSRSYPIWNKITACIYQGDKSFGAKQTSEQTILVGSSAKNSETLATIITTKREFNHEKHGRVIVFKHSCDGVILKEAIFKTNGDKAGELIEINSALKNFKGL